MFLKKDISVRNITKKIFYHSGLANYLLSCNRHKLLILCHHRISPPGDKFTYLGVSQDIFEQQVVFLKKYFNIVSFEEGVESLKRRFIGKSLLVLTFDDGYRDNYLHAFPILKRYGVTATIFLSPGFIGMNDTFWWDSVAEAILKFPGLKGDVRDKVDIIEDTVDLLKKLSPVERQREIEKLEEKFGPIRNSAREREILNWEEIKEMSGYGIDFGSHAMTHSNLTLLGQKELEQEVLKSKDIIEDVLKKEIHSFAYPYGFYNEDVKKMVKKTNYSYARSMMSGFNEVGQDLFTLKCISGYSYGLEDLVSRLSYKGL